MTGKHRSAERAKDAGHPIPDLGQEKAQLEKASDEQLSHMEGGKAAKSALKQKEKVAKEVAGNE